MGLTSKSVGINAIDNGLIVNKKSDNDKVIALAGNPNVGKSTVFNALTGMKQHTGNWPGKTVSNAQGECVYNGVRYIFVDLPGAYSLSAHSKEEEVAGEFLCSGNYDRVIVVCDATCLERNLNLVIQIIEITDNVTVCVNLMDEARKKKIDIDISLLSEKLKVPVAATEARKKRGLLELLNSVNYSGEKDIRLVTYPVYIEEAIELAENDITGSDVKKRHAALKGLLDGKFPDAWEILRENGITTEKLEDITASCTVLKAEEIYRDVVKINDEKYSLRDRRIDRFLTNRITGVPVMILMLIMVFWLTITGANYPSEILSQILFRLRDVILDLLISAGVPEAVYNPLIFGVYHVLAWIVSVMLPPMAIFFPLFTLLEDLGYLPRVAFNMDKVFQKCHACGKQALTMCMGFGCNAAGVVGCRIIDSPRERLIAILTNSFVPCNGRFPSLIAVITMFFVFSQNAGLSAVVSAFALTGAVLLGIFITFAASFLLSKTILKGEPSSFTLELPPYRKPQITQVIIRSVFDRTVFVLGRAVLSAAPAGLLIWIFANVIIGDASLLTHCSNFLNPFAQLMGLDGVILMAFILGMPANEIVIPIIIMAYTMTGTLTEMNDLIQMKALFVQNGWDWTTAVSFIIFSILHWPCATTLLTVKKETGSLKWTILAFMLPAVLGVILCMLFNCIVSS